MNRKSFTLILVPNAKSKLRRFTFSSRSLSIAGGVCAVVLLATGIFLYRSMMIAWQVSELEAMRLENAQLRQANLDYHKSVEMLKGKINSLREYTKKLNTIAGISDPSAITMVGMGGIGGFAEPAATGAMSRPLSSELGVLKTEARQIEKQMQSLTQFFTNQSLILASTPSIWPTTGYLSCGYGWRLDPLTRQNDFHHGLDISSPIGQPVVATAAGVVVFAGPKSGYGNVLVIDHDFGYQTRYGHLSGFAVKPGKKIERGQVVAYVGNTGKSTGPHLHYEVLVHNQPVNPIEFILEEYLKM